MTAWSGNDEPFHPFLLTRNQIQQFHRNSGCAGLSDDDLHVQARLSESETAERLDRKQRLIQIAARQDGLWAGSFPYRHFVWLTDQDGCLLHMRGSADLLSCLHERGIRDGSCLRLDTIGTHALTAALDLRRPVYLNGTEHYKTVFHESASCAVPLGVQGGEPEGWMCLTCSADVGIAAMAPLVQAVRAVIERELASIGDLVHEAADEEEQLQLALEELPLTPREKEVANYWLLDYDYKQISRVLDISVNTVRRHIENMYPKLGVNSKSSLHLKLKGLL
ncbi:LuxR C-terminal-related transcriptional regulator [Paenibacillus aurantiacus]|uniref:LuxR C-terminal-related transcriptional regulator n=1 Tax=Paenibacillus aurantiacus TaxID=1936118 RepID=A0ABV5KGS1_9BACL